MERKTDTTDWEVVDDHVIPVHDLGAHSMTE